MEHLVVTSAKVVKATGKNWTTLVGGDHYNVLLMNSKGEVVGMTTGDTPADAIARARASFGYTGTFQKAR